MIHYSAPPEPAPIQRAMLPHSLVPAIIADEAFEFVDGPIRRVTVPDTLVPFSPTMEDFLLPKADDVARAVRSLLEY